MNVEFLLVKVLYVNPVGFPAYDQVFVDMKKSYKF